MFSDILLTVDYDRTLTASDSSIPARNLEAIGWFMANGGTFTVNTGRSVPMCRGGLLEVPVNGPLLLYNGSAAYDQARGGLTQVRPLDLDIRVLEDLQARFPALNVEVQAVDAHYLLKKNAAWERFCDRNGCPWRYAEVGQIPGPFLKFTFYGQFHDETVASMYEATPEELAVIDRAMDWMEKTYGHRLEIFRACPRIVDFHAKGCNKLRAARQLQKALGKKRLVCVGDGENDLAMLSGADHAFCPAESAVSDRFETVCSCDEGAVADVIYEKIPEILGLQP